MTLVLPNTTQQNKCPFIFIDNMTPCSVGLPAWLWSVSIMVEYICAKPYQKPDIPVTTVIRLEHLTC